MPQGRDRRLCRGLRARLRPAPSREGVAVERLEPRQRSGFRLRDQPGRHHGRCRGARRRRLSPAHHPARGRARCRRASCSSIPRSTATPAQLPDGAVLVVGSGQSGCQIAEDLHLSRAAGASGRRQRAALSALLSRPRRGRLARRSGLVRPARAPASAAGGRARQDQPLRHRPRWRPRHRSAQIRRRGHAALRPPAGSVAKASSASTTIWRRTSTRPTPSITASAR